MTDAQRLDFLTRIENGTPPVYFKSSLENAVVKSLPDNKFEVRIKNAETFISEPLDGKLSKLVTDGMIEAAEITAEEFERF